MKALVQYEKKNGAAELRDVPVPEIGTGDVLVRVKAAGICGADIEFYRAKADNIRPPVVLGHEFCGVVERVGQGVTAWKPGDRVVSDNSGYVCGTCSACVTGKFLLCPARLGLGYGMDGGFAEFVRIPGQVLGVHPRALMRLPDAIPFETGAVLEPAANSFMAVVQEGKAQAGDTVVVFGPGPIGLFAAAIAKVAGAAEVILVGGSADRLAMGERAGATRVINYRTLKNAAAAGVAEEIEKIVGVNAVDLLIDAAGGAGVLADCMRLVKPRGRIVKAAWSEAEPLCLSPLMFKGAEVTGHFGFDSESWARVMRLAESGAIDFKSFISGTYRLEQWKEAFGNVENKKHIKALFTTFA